MKRLSLFLATTALLAGLTVPATAAADPTWHIGTSAPDRIVPGGMTVFVIGVKNVGDADTDGTGALDVTLPSGITAVSMTAHPLLFGPDQPPSAWSCDPLAGASTVHCALNTVASPGSEPQFGGLFLKVAADPGASGDATATFEVSGGGAATVSTTDTTKISSAPNFGIAAFDGSVTADQAGSAFTQAGGHPYAVSTTINFNTRTNSVEGDFWPDEPIKDVLVDVPPGLIGNPTALAQCSLDQLVGTQEHNYFPECPAASQVGIAKITSSFLGIPFDSVVSVYSMVAPPDVPARFAFIAAGTVVSLDAELRSGSDYGLSVNVKDASGGLPIIGTYLTLWGTPADPVHTPERSCSGKPIAVLGGPTCFAGVPPQAFLSLPTSCAGPQTTTVHASSWFHPSDFKSASFVTHLPPGLREDPNPPHFFAPSFPGLPSDQWGDPQGATDCEQVPFDPGISLQPTSHQADSPTGLSVDLTVPQEDITNPDLLSPRQSDLRKAVVTLPEGMSVNPSSADGLGACSSAQIDLHSSSDPTCPDASKIGSLTIDTPLLDEQLQGSVYLAAQGDNPFNSLLALYLVARGPGLIVKLPGHVVADPDTGRLETVFDNQPQLPFSHLHLQLKSGNRAPLINPPTCGSYSTQSELTPWSGNAAVDQSSSFNITSGPNGGACPSNPNGLSPTLEAGLTNPVAGATGDFNLKLNRGGDAMQRLKTLDVTTPPGLSAYLKGIPYCPDAVLNANALASRLGATELAAPSCPSVSQLGVLTTGAGAGPSPFYVQSGKVYLAGPYQGEPLSLAVMVPAVAGPLDLGTVLVRTPIHIDPSDAHLSVHTELPTILQGIPLDVRSVDLSINRPNFILGPTNCSQMQVDARVSGTGGATANLSNPLQMVDCAALGFKPRLSLRLKGGTKRADHPRLIASLRARPGQANIDRASVALPHSEFLDQSHIRTVCTRVQFAASACPKGSIYGHAKAITPLLDQPLEGPVYLRSSDHELPDLVASLDGQIHIDLVGRIDTARSSGIRNSFEVVPDAPVTKFTLTMRGGRKGLLENSVNLCARAHRATVLFDGQNGKVRDFRPLVRADCGSKPHKAHRTGRAGR